MSKRVQMSQEELLEWLATNHPDLFISAEIDRTWVWLTANLKDKPEVRESIKAQGFIWARWGHTLPSGNKGTWGHSCVDPRPFRRRFKGRPAAKQTTPETDDTETSGRLDPAELVVN